MTKIPSPDGNAVRANIVRNTSRHYMAQPMASGRLNIAFTGTSLGELPLDDGFPVLAVNGSMDYLTIRGREPWGGVIVEASPVHIKTIGFPSDETTYFLASRVDQGVFAHLSGREVLIWHVDGDQEKKAVHRMPLLGGSHTTAPAVLGLAAYLGFDEIHTYGLDLCRQGEKWHAHQCGTEPGNEEDVTIQGRKFRTTQEQIRQYGACQELIRKNPRVDWHIHGNGLLAHWMKRKAPPGRGVLVEETPFSPHLYGRELSGGVIKH